MDKLRVAVIGAGAMGKSHIRVYFDMNNVELVAVADSNEETLKEISKKYKVKTYRDYSEMISKEKIDAASICVPTIMHKEIGLKCIMNKINVLIEKPIAKDTDEADQLIEESKKNKTKLMIGHIERFNPVVVELKKRIEKNELGKIYKVHCARLSPFPQRVVDVGVIIDLAIHEIDILKYLINSKVKRVYAETSRKIHSSHEDLLIGTLKFDNGIIGVINTNWLTPKKVREITVTGEKGMFVANYLTQELYFYENEFTKNDYNGNFMNVTEGSMTKIKIISKEPLRNELESFIDCIANLKPVPITGEDGKNAIIIAQKFQESSKLNKVVEL